MAEATLTPPAPTKKPAKGNFFLRNFERTDKIFRVFRRLPAFIRNRIIDAYVARAKASAVERFCPERMTLFLTNKCNMKCAHCFIIKEVQPTINMMQLEDYRKMFRSVRGGCTQVLLTGGEITLRKDLADIIISAAKDGGVRTCNIFSNGLKLDALEEHLTKVLENCDVNLNYQTSLDGMQPFHDFNRRVPGAFESAVESVKRIRALSEKYPGRFSRIIMATAVSKQNLQDLSDMCDIVLKAGATPTFCFVRTSDDTFNLKDQRFKSEFSPEKTKADGSVKFADGDYLSVEEMDRALKIMNDKVWSTDPDRLNFNYNRVTLEAVRNSKDTFISPLTDECRMGYDDVVVLADGLVSRCENLIAPVTLRDFDFNLPKLMQSEAWQKYMSDTSGCWCTHDCGIGVSMMKEAPLLKQLVQLK